MREWKWWHSALIFLSILLMGFVLAPLVIGGSIYGRTVFYDDVSVGLWSGISNMTITTTNITGGAHAAGTSNFIYRLNGTNLLGRLPLSTNQAITFTGSSTTNSIYLTWPRYDGVTKIVIERSLDNGTNWKWYAIAPGSTSFTDDGSHTWLTTVFSNLYSVIGEPSVPWFNATTGVSRTEWQNTNTYFESAITDRYTKAETDAAFALTSTAIRVFIVEQDVLSNNVLRVYIVEQDALTNNVLRTFIVEQDALTNNVLRQVIIDTNNANRAEWQADDAATNNALRDLIITTSNGIIVRVALLDGSQAWTGNQDWGSFWATNMGFLYGSSGDGSGVDLVNFQLIGIDPGTSEAYTVFDWRLGPSFSTNVNLSNFGFENLREPLTPSDAALLSTVNTASNALEASIANASNIVRNFQNSTNRVDYSTWHLIPTNEAWEISWEGPWMEERTLSHVWYQVDWSTCEVQIVMTDSNKWWREIEVGGTNIGSTTVGTGGVWVLEVDMTDATVPAGSRLGVKIVDFNTVCSNLTVAVRSVY